MIQFFELNQISRHFADFICKESSSKSPVLRHVVSLASWAVENGDICFNLAEIAGQKVQIDGEKISMPALDELKAFLHEMPAVGFPSDYKPLVIEEGRLYLYRYWKYEQNLAGIIRDRSKKECQNIDRALLENGLNRLFPCEDFLETDWQREAALRAVLKPFCVISGGPGTGKTYTVVKIIALLLEQAKSRVLRIALAAPTGKSAARLKDSINLMKDGLNCSDSIKEKIPLEVSTIHRLLGVTGPEGQVRHSDKNLLPYDVIVVDEASMVSLPLMAKLVIAMRQDARLILVGDRHQLASVEAGSVLADVCEGASDSLIILRKNYRFKDKSGLNVAGKLVNSGEGAKAAGLLKNDTFPDFTWRDVPKPDAIRKALAALTLQAFGPYFASQNAAEALKFFDTFRVLCALRHGAYGVIAINSMIEGILEENNLIDSRNRWYHGRPVMITSNDYNLKLFNGDVGITFPDHGSGGSLRVFFPAHDGGLRNFSPVRLPAHETVYAMTIHKSQGSEFDGILMLLPPQDSQILTRELIYTGITRAKKEAQIWADESVFVNAVSRRTDRKSGLRDRLLKS